MTETHDFKNFLREEFLRRARKNPRYSMRAFALFLNMDPSTLGKILKGKRPLRRRAIERIAERLGLDPGQAEIFMKKSTDKNSDDHEFQSLTLDAFQMIADWYHYAILELMAIEGFRSEDVWIARSLGISPEETRVALERLERLDMIQKNKEGEWIDISSSKTTTLDNHFTATAFKKLQKQVLEKAITSLEEVPFEKRQQYSATMAIDPKWVPQANSLISEFGRNMHKFLGTQTSAKQVYHLNVSLYPVTHLNDQEEKENTHENIHTHDHPTL